MIATVTKLKKEVINAFWKYQVSLENARDMTKYEDIKEAVILIKHIEDNDLEGVIIQDYASKATINLQNYVVQ